MKGGGRRPSPGDVVAMLKWDEQETPVRLVGGHGRAGSSTFLAPPGTYMVFLLLGAIQRDVAMSRQVASALLGQLGFVTTEDWVHERAKAQARLQVIDALETALRALVEELDGAGYTPPVLADGAVSALEAARKTLSDLKNARKDPPRPGRADAEEEAVRIAGESGQGAEGAESPEEAGREGGPEGGG